MKRKSLGLSLSTAVVGLFVLAGCGDATATSAPAAVSTTAPVAAATTALVMAATTAPASGASTLPKLATKATYTVGFAQIVSNNPWRLAETKSMQDEAAKRGWKLVYTDAGDSTAKQISDVESMISQKVDAIFLPPREEKPLVKAVQEAQAAGIPVFLIDRDVDESIVKAGQNFVTVIESDFVQEGQRAAAALVKATNGTAKIIELEGTPGASAATDRKTGFDTAIKASAGMQIIASQSGNFARDEGRKTMETLLAAHPEVTAVYAHNDEMALGAIAALTAAGKVPGKDVIVVSIDGEKDGIQAVADGKMLATVECNPRFGPKAFDTLVSYAKGETIAPKIINVDNFYDISNAKDSLATAY